MKDAVMGSSFCEAGPSEKAICYQFIHQPFASFCYNKSRNNEIHRRMTMKKILSLLLVLLMLGSLIACNGNTDETESDTRAETADETAEETAGQSLETESETAEQITEAITAGRLPKGKMPSTVYFCRQGPGGGDMSLDYLFGSLQGLSAKYCDEHVIYDEGTFDRYFNAYIEDMMGAPISETVDGKPVTVQSLAEHYYGMGFIKGYILCSEENPASLQVGVSLAGLMDGLIATEKNRDMLDQIGYECLFDARECDDAWLRASEYWSRLRTDISFAQPHGLAPHLVDYAILCGGTYFTFYQPADPEGHAATYEFLDDNAIVFGYCGDLGEWGTVYSFSGLNANMIPSNYVANLATLSSFVLENPKQKRPAVSEDVENVHTITFVYSDGDNLSATIWNFPLGVYSSSQRGQFPMGWGMPATGIDLVAPAYAYYYDSMTENDEFVMSLSGVGYTFPAAWTAEARAEMTEELADYMRRSDIQYMIMLDDAPGAWDEEVFADFTEHDGIEGIFYVGAYNKNGNVVWTNGKPTVGCRSGFTGGYEGTYNDILRFLQRKTLSTDVKKTRSYSMYYVGAWCTGMDVVESLIEQLPEYVEVVTPGVFMERMVANCKPSETDAE